jgi:hypothetical protein
LHGHIPVTAGFFFGGVVFFFGVSFFSSDYVIVSGFATVEDVAERRSTNIGHSLLVSYEPAPLLCLMESSST